MSQVYKLGACKARVVIDHIARRRKNGGYFICSIGRRNRNGYRLAKGTECIRCGFIPEHWSQLDVDHIDGDHRNNALENLQTLCANCHRFKSNEDKRNWTHCHKGHPFDAENTYIPPGGTGRRHCKQCANDRARMTKALGG